MLATDGSVADPWELDQEMGLLGRVSTPTWGTGSWDMQGCPRARLGRRTAKKLLQLGQCPVLTWPGSWARREAVSRVCMDREGQKGFLTPLRFQFIPESVRYNISKGNVAAALATLQRIAEMNRAVMPEGVLKEPAKVNQTPALPDPSVPGRAAASGGWGGSGTAKHISLCLFPPPHLVFLQTAIECDYKNVIFLLEGQ